MCACSYYHLEEVSQDSVNAFLSGIVRKSLSELEESYCIAIDEVSYVIRNHED